MKFSKDQASAYDAVVDGLKKAGIDLDNETLAQRGAHEQQTVAVLGKAGSGKTMLLAKLAADLSAAGVQIIGGDYEAQRHPGQRTLAILAPTNKAASVLRNQGVAATTIHRILYTPVYDPEYEKIAKWLTADAKIEKKPEVKGISDSALERAALYYKSNKSIPGALAMAGLRGSDFITGWRRRDDPMDVGFVDESSMLDDEQVKDLREIFPTLILFGDPAQLAPVGQSGNMAFDGLPEAGKLKLSRIHRQAEDSPILDLAHALGDPQLEYYDFEEMIKDAALSDERVIIASRVDAAAMARSPVLVWRNATRIRLIHAFRKSFDTPEEILVPGEPLICDGIELPAKHRHKRIDLETRGLIKGAQAVYLSEGRKAGFSRLHMVGAESPQVSAATIIKLEMPGEEQPILVSAARMGATFVHGAACTIHKAQGSQWTDVQVFAPDILAASRSALVEAGIALWKRLAYVAITRAEQRLFWVTKYMMSKPTESLSTDDLKSVAKADLALESQPPTTD